MSGRHPADSTPAPDEPTLVGWLRGLRSAEAVYVSDPNQRIVTWSAAAERLTGYAAAEVVGRPCYEVIAGTEPDGHPVCRRNCRVVTNARRGRPTASYDVVARRKDGDGICLRNCIIVAEGGGRRRPYLLHVVRPATAPDGTLAIVPAMPRLGEAADRATIPPIGQPLSRRELEVVRLLAAGRPTAEIAEALSISRFTARNHIANVQRKLGAQNRVEAVVHAAHHHLI